MKGPGFRFREVMQGHAQRPGERFDRPFRFDLEVHAPSVLAFVTGTTVAPASGTLRLDGLASAARAEGHLELSPFRRQIMRYVLDFTADDGLGYRFDGQKRTTLRRHLVGWTTLPGKIYDASGAVWGEALLRFSLRHDLVDLLRSGALEPSAGAP